MCFVRSAVRVKYCSHSLLTTTIRGRFFHVKYIYPVKPVVKTQRKPIFREKFYSPEDPTEPAFIRKNFSFLLFLYRQFSLYFELLRYSQCSFMYNSTRKTNTIHNVPWRKNVSHTVILNISIRRNRHQCDEYITKKKLRKLTITALNKRTY